MIQIEATETTQLDLDVINTFTLTPLQQNDVFTFSAKFIDDKVTANNRVFTREWQTANVGKFVGVPVTVNHDLSDADLVMGRIYRAEIKENAIVGKVFIPTLTESGKQNAVKVKTSQFKAMSINTKSNNARKENGVDVILPGDDDRILEVSFVASGGCRECGVTKCECGRAEETKDATLLEFAKQQLDELQNTFIRSASFTLGTSISKATYKKVAESVDPLTLKTLTEDLKRAYESNKTSKAETSPAPDIKNEIEKLRDLMGV